MKDIRSQLPTHSTLRYPVRPRGDIGLIVVHHAAVPPTVTPTAIARYHVEHHGWAGIGYHFCITSGGHIYWTNSLETVSRHARAVDHKAVGICLLGDFTDHPPTRLQLIATRRAIEWIESELGRELEIVGHRDVMNTQCPGNTWLQWKDQIMPVEEEEQMITRKVGLHDMYDSGVDPGRPAIIKLVETSLAYYRRTRNLVGSDCLIVVRFMEEAQPLDDPVQRAREWMQRHRGFIEAIPANEKVVYEGYNEIGDDRSAPYAQFEVERLGLLHEIRRRGCVLNASVGTPAEHVWPVYQPVLDTMIEGDVVGLHEYWVDEAGIDNRWHVGRFTLPEVAPFLEGKEIAITECGRDRINDPNLPPDERGESGWQRSCDADQYVRDLRKAGEFYDTQPRVRGATVFQTGSWSSEWDPFDVAAIWPRVVAQYPEAPPTPEPAPEPEPPTEHLPSTDGATLEASDIVSMQRAVRWWGEETKRAVEANNAGRADRILADLIAPDGVLYRAEAEAERLVEEIERIAELEEALDAVRDWYDKAPL